LAVAEKEGVMRARLCLICTAIELISVSPAAGQARVERIIPQSGRVSVQRAGSVAIERAEVGAALLPGDVAATRDSSLLELRCTEEAGNTYRLQGPFRVLIDVPIDSTCHVNLLAGHGDVIAESPSATTAGGIALGSSGTQYSVEVTREGDQLVRQVAVFEGEVGVRGSGRGVAQGSELRWVGLEATSASLSRHDIERSAEVYARFDAAAAAAEAPGGDSAATYRQLKQLHYDVLANPADTAKRVELAKRQIQYKASYQAAYNLRRANVTNDAALRRYQIDPAVVRANPVLRERIYRAPAGATVRPDTARHFAGEAAVTRERTVTREGAVTKESAVTKRDAVTAGSTVTPAPSVSREARAARVRATPTTESDLQLIAAGQVDQAIRNLEGRVAGYSANSRDYFALAKAYEGRDAAKARANADRARALNASDGKLTAADLVELDEVLGRVR
jgi:hypothetical protein